MKKLVVVDGNSLMFRAFYATSYGDIMHTKSGIFTNALYTFIIFVNHILKEKNITNLVFAFDKGSHTLRHQEFSDYKGTRKKMPEELKIQVPLIKEYLDLMNITHIELDDYEADDICGTIAFKYHDLFDEVDVISGDKDFLQLVKDNIHVRLTKKGLSDLEEYTIDNFYEKMQFYPYQLIDYKGLCGDTSDNIPGIQGIGPKTAVDLLSRFNTVEGVIEHVGELKGKLKENVENGRESGLYSKHLATIYTDANFEYDFNKSILVEPNYKELKEFFLRYELNSFMNLIKTVVNEDIKDIELEYYNDDLDKLNNEKLEDIVVEVINNKVNYHNSNNLGIIILVNNHSYYFNNPFSVKDILENNNINKYCVDSKKVIYTLSKLGININNIVFDLYLASYCVDPSTGVKDYKEIIDLYKENNLKLDVDIYGKKEPFSYSLELVKNISLKLYYLYSIKDLVLNKIKECDMEYLYYNIELPLSKVLSRIENNGFKVNVDRINELEVIFNEKLKTLELSIYEAVGHEFNINSPKQLGDIIFEELALAKGKKGKSGAYSTSADVLEKLAKKHPFVAQVLEYRKYAKLISTYINGLRDVIGEDSFIHTTFNQYLTLTGRLSSTEPNIQNIPVRTEEGRLIRTAFIPREIDGVLISADYSQIELRVLADMANCYSMIDEINHGKDFHTSTASMVFNVKPEDVTKEMRKLAKAANFGIVYGISSYGLSEDLGIEIYEAKDYIDKYFEIFPEIRSFLDKTVSDCESLGYTKTIYNRRRYIPEIKSSNYMLKEFGKRTSMNAPIQGSAADIMKLAMIKVQENLDKANLESKIVAQVHDELIIDCLNSEKDLVKKILVDSMEHVVNLKVKLDVSVEEGSNWDIK